MKSGDVTGSSSSSNGYFTLINQVKQCFNESYKHIYDIDEVRVDECLIIVSGVFKPTSLDSVFGSLRQERLDKFIREAIDIDKLISLVDEFFPEYWDECEDEIKKLREERNYLLNNTAKLLKALISDSLKFSKVMTAVSSKDLEIDIDSFLTTNRYIADITYNKIKIDQIDPFYKDEIFSSGNIPEETFRKKLDAEDILFEMNELIDTLKTIILEQDPEKVALKCEELRSFVGQYGFQFSTKNIHSINDYWVAIQEYKKRKEFLINNGLYDIHKVILNDVKEKISSLLQMSLQTETSKSYWIGYKFKITNQDVLFESEAYDFTRELELKEYRYGKYYETEKAFTDLEGFTRVEYYFQRYIDKVIDKKSTASIVLREGLETFVGNVSEKLSNYELECENDIGS